MEDHLDDTGVLRYKDILSSHVCAAEGELAPESGVDIPCTKEETPPSIGRTASEGCGEIGRQLNPFKSWDKRALTPDEIHFFCHPEIIGGGLEAGVFKGTNHQIAVSAVITKPVSDHSR
jgi:hypothetical protein